MVIVAWISYFSISIWFLCYYVYSFNCYAFCNSFLRRLLFWYFLEHITLPVIRIYWAHNFSISRHTVKHVLSQVKKNNRKNIFRKEWVSMKITLLSFWKPRHRILLIFIFIIVRQWQFWGSLWVGAKKKQRQRLLKEEAGTKSNILAE